MIKKIIAFIIIGFLIYACTSTIIYVKAKKEAPVVVSVKGTDSLSISPDIHPEINVKRSDSTMIEKARKQ